METIHLKSAATLFTEQATLVPQSRFSNETPCILAAVGVAKLQEVGAKIVFQGPSHRPWPFLRVILK